MRGGEYLDEEYLLNQWNNLQNYFSNELKCFKGSVQEYLLGLNPEVHLVGKVFFHLVENKEDSEFPFAFMATYLANVNEGRNSAHRPLKYALNEYENNQEKMLFLLSTIRRASEKLSLIKGLLNTGGIFEPLRWPPTEAQRFLEEVPLYSKAGVLCRIPNWWKSASQGVKLNLSVGEKRPSLLGTDTLVDFDIGLSFGGEELSEREARKLLDESNGLAFLKGKWVNVDSENLSKALEKWTDVKKIMREHQISFNDAMKVLSGRGNDILGIDLSDFEITQGKWLKGLTEKLKDPVIIKNTAISKNLRESSVLISTWGLIGSILFIP